MRNVDLVVIGGGPAGMCAAVSAYNAGIKSILVLERDAALGGILQQCIHNGFGLHRFKEELTGPEYAHRCEKELRELPVEIQCGTMVTDISRDKVVTAVSPEKGVEKIYAKAIILAMGCRERPRGALNIPGSRPAGIFSAGTAQKYVNMMGYMPGKNVVILGSGDIGLIMARRMTLEGAKVHAVCEVMPYSGGLARNIEQCLNDFEIPLYLSHTVTKIHGDKRITGVTISKVDEKMQPVKGNEFFIECDTLLLSVGLIPENELSKGAGLSLDNATRGCIVDQSRETEAEGIFACGNVLHVHDLADYVSEEGEIAGKGAAEYILGLQKKTEKISVSGNEYVRYTVPQFLSSVEGNMKIYYRTGSVLSDVTISVVADGVVVSKQKKKKIVPGEMQFVLLKDGDIPEFTKEIKVCIDKN
ncbi:MAG: FAD-binding protein [Ruminococcaceae bacterium]|nr:FAD-binding protein [Oscillospiraceae bacterium]